ncbi:MAG: primosomal protein N' [Candidatus Omnitrophota bacterium]
MLYARVVFGLRIEGPFDYIVPEQFRDRIKPGCRVLVPLRNRQIIGYVVSLTRQSRVKRLKAIVDLPDSAPLLDKNMLLLTEELSRYYCCSWGEAIETAIPEQFRKKRSFSLAPLRETPSSKPASPGDALLLQDLDGKERWDVYSAAIKEAVANNKSAIILLPDISATLRAREFISARIGIEARVLYRKQPKATAEWLGIREGGVGVVAGTRSAIFAPLNDPGLIIIDEEEDSAYKQDQVPHYHAREIAAMRARITGARLILGSVSPSLESFQLLRGAKEGVKYEFIGRRDAFPQIRIIDSRNIPYSHGAKKKLFFKYFSDAVGEALLGKKKILFFANRRGFATYVSCPNCNAVIRCQRCNSNLVYHYKENILSCHYCNFRMEPPSICPHCNSAYIRYSGTGTEKIESELSREFPQARIKILDEPDRFDMDSADIFIATESVFGLLGSTFDVTLALFIDDSLNRADLRAAEKTFALLLKLLRMTGSKMLIRTGIPHHHCFKALTADKVGAFYEEELKERQQLEFPPCRHLAVVKVRGKKEALVREAAEGIYKGLKGAGSKRRINVISLNPGHPSRLRGNFYWQILLRSDDPLRMSRFLKMRLKESPHSGIIVTVDVDPL